MSIAFVLVFVRVEYVAPGAEWSGRPRAWMERSFGTVDKRFRP
jgi:hypothetical protein